MAFFEVNIETTIPPNTIKIEHKTCRVAFRTKLKDEDEWSVWKSQFEAMSKTNWIVQTLSNCKSYRFSKNYICHHTSSRKTVHSKKNCTCEAVLRIRIKYNTKHVRYRDKYAKV